MKLYKLPQEARAATGWTHMAHFKVADSDLTAVDQVHDVMPWPVGGLAGKAAFHTKTVFATITTPAIDAGVAATATGNDTLIDGGSLGTANNTVYGGTNAVHFKINNTASRFVTIKQIGTTASATAGEGYMFFTLVDVTTFVADPANI